MGHVQRSREAYGRSAERYLAAVGSTVSPGFEAASDLDLLKRFARTVGTVGGRALDVGCGTGRIARLLGDHGVPVVGIDVAPGMVEVARREHPDIAFAVGELADLPIADGAVAAVASWYSIITTPPDRLPAVWTELERVLAPGGLALVAFQAGPGKAVARPDAYGTGVDLTLYRHDPATVADGLGVAGLQVEERLERPPALEHEDSPQGFLLARC